MLFTFSSFWQGGHWRGHAAPLRSAVEGVQEVELLAPKAHRGNLDAAISVAHRHRHRKVDFFSLNALESIAGIVPCYTIVFWMVLFVCVRVVLAKNHTLGFCDSISYVLCCFCCDSSCVDLIWRGI
jgi:hypothetical protein